MQRVQDPRRAWPGRTLGAAVVAAAMLAAAMGVAGAANPNATTKATSIQAGVSCPTIQAGEPVGAATFTRRGDRLTLVVELTAATPDATYDVELWDALSCTAIASLKDLRADRDGAGTVRGHVDVAGHTEFLATAIDADGVRSDSLPVTLP